MANGRLGGVAAGHLRTLIDEGAVGGLSDGELLGRFLDDRDESAFGALVCRHGPLVFGVCRRTLRDAHQTEDAFQATFLVLARKAGSIRNREAVGPWLVGVAGKVAARARGDALRRRVHEGRAAERTPAGSIAEPDHREEVAALLGEVARLRRPLREAVVLCHLQGFTYDSAAAALGVTEGTIRGRLARARQTLRARLERRGVARDAPASVILVPGMLGRVPERLIEPTIRGSMAIATGRAATGIVPGTAITLMEGALKAMLVAKWKTAAVVALGVGLVAVGAQARPRPKPPQAPGGAAKGSEKAGEPADLAAVVPGRVVRSAEVTKDCMILSYLPDWAFGNVDNIGVASNDGGNRTLVDWPDVPALEAKSADLKFYLAFFARKTTAKPRPGSLLGFELEGEWPERTSWKTRPSSASEPAFTTAFEPGEGWKLFEITSVVREHQGKSGDGLMLRFVGEDRFRGSAWSGYEFVSREGQGEWAGRRPMLLVVEPPKKVGARLDPPKLAELQTSRYDSFFLGAFW